MGFGPWKFESSSPHHSQSNKSSYLAPQVTSRIRADRRLIRLILALYPVNRGDAHGQPRPGGGRQVNTRATPSPPHRGVERGAR